MAAAGVKGLTGDWYTLHP